jgi:hypothetical protein
VKSSVAGVMPVQLYDGTNLVSTTVTIAAASTAQFVTATFPAQTTWAGSTSNGIGAYLRVLAASSGGINIVGTNGNTFEWTGLIVLPGLQLPSASHAPLIMRPYDQEFQLCSRHLTFNKDRTHGFLLGGVGTTSPTFVFNTQFAVPMRANPTVVLQAASFGAECLPWTTGYTLSAITLGAAGHIGLLGGDIQLSATANASVSGSIGSPATLTSTGVIKFDARL